MLSQIEPSALAQECVISWPSAQTPESGVASELANCSGLCIQDVAKTRKAKLRKRDNIAPHRASIVPIVKTGT